jgi:hypothetical protein
VNSNFFLPRTIAGPFQLKRLVAEPPDSTMEETMRWRWSPLEPGGGDMLLFLCTQQTEQGRR